MITLTKFRNYINKEQLANKAHHPLALVLESAGHAPVDGQCLRPSGAIERTGDESVPSHPKFTHGSLVIDFTALLR